MERIKIGVIGLNFGRHIVAQLTSAPANQYFELAALCDLDVEKAKKMAAPIGAKVYGSIDALLADKEIPAIGLYTGPVGRAKLIRQIIRAGRDVMTTKPLELDADAALEVLKEAKQLGRIVHLNSPSPVVTAEALQINQWREKYSLGRPIACRRETWASYREKADGNWYDDPTKCPAAPIFRLGIYLINDLVGIFGDAERVQVLQSRIFTGRPTADNAQLGILFKSGAIANVYASFCIADGDHYRNTTILNFENGTIYGNSGPARKSRESAHGGYVNDFALVMADGPKRKLVEQVELDHNSGEYRWDLFHRAIKGGKLENELPLEQIVAGVRIIRGMMDAEKTGTAVVRY